MGPHSSGSAAEGEGEPSKLKAARASAGPGEGNRRPGMCSLPVPILHPGASGRARAAPFVIPGEHRAVRMKGLGVCTEA